MNRDQDVINYFLYSAKKKIRYLWRQPNVFDVRFWHFWGWRRVHHHLELGVGEVTILVLVGEGEHLLDILLFHVHRKVLHQVDKVLFPQGMLLQLVFLCLIVLWVRVGATHHLVDG